MPICRFTTSKYFLLKLTIYKICKLSKLIVFTNLWKNFVYLFAKSEFVIGQFQPVFVILFLRTCLCFFNRSHSHSKWSVVCGLILQRHVGSSIILNLWKYVLSLPCPVIIVEKFMHICRVPTYCAVKLVPGLSPRVSGGLGVKMTTHFRIVLRLRMLWMRESLPPLPYT